MKSHYKKIGDYIQLVDERNAGLKVKTLLGLSISKQFIPSVANIIGTDMENYKIIRRNHFACSTMQVRRDRKMPVALLQDFDEAIISPAYPVFEVADPKTLLPEYLMMWFSRSEFDREALFYAIGGVRGSLEWEDFCNMTLPIPSPIKQKEIIQEYNIILNRIDLNNQLIRKLEETAQAVYKQWFVDFEFPNENGEPCKSAGGEMMESELGDIPKGWEISPLKEIASQIITGKTPLTDDEDNFGDYMPFVTIPDMHDNVFVVSAERYLSQKGVNLQKNKTLPENTLCVSCIGTAGLVSILSRESQTNQQINSVICKSAVSIYYIFFTLRSLEHQIQEWGNKGSVGINMNKAEFSNMKIIQPHTTVMEKFEIQVKPFFESIKLHQRERELLYKIKDTLLSKLATVIN